MDAENAMSCILVVGLAILVALVLYCLGAGALSNGRVDYCYVQADQHQEYQLVGHRNWISDLQIGDFPSFDAAIAAAGKLNCPLH